MTLAILLILCYFNLNINKTIQQKAYYALD